MKRIIILIACAIVACAGAVAVTADATYGGQLLSCENRASSKDEAHTCRADVDHRWCVVDGAPMCVPEGGLGQ